MTACGSHGIRRIVVRSGTIRKSAHPLLASATGRFIGSMSMSVANRYADAWTPSPSRARARNDRGVSRLPISRPYGSGVAHTTVSMAPSSASSQY